MKIKHLFRRPHWKRVALGVAVGLLSLLAAGNCLAIGDQVAIEPRSEVPFGRQVSATGIRHAFLITGSTTAILDEESHVAWQVKRPSRDGFVLPSGNVLVSHGDEAIEYQRDGKIVFRYKLSAENKELGTAVRLADGSTMLVERGPLPRLVEVDVDGKILRQIPLEPESDNAHMQTRMARKQPDGHYLVPHLLAFAVKEYDGDGNVVRRLATDLPELGGRAAENWPFTAIALPSGHLLVNLTHGNKIVEMDLQGKIVWRVDNQDVADRFSDPCGGQRLANGNTVVCSYGQQKPDMPKVFEITHDKQVVWEYLNPDLRGIHEIHILTTNGEPVAWPPWK